MAGVEEKVRIVIDTNKIFSVLLSEDETKYKIILSSDLNLYFPEFGLLELEKYKKVKERYRSGLLFFTQAVIEQNKGC